MVFIAGLIVIALASLAFGVSSVATQKAGQPVATETIVVGSGQTLWDIASDIAAQTGEEDVRDVMHEIKQLNALESGMLMAGQLLRVPAAGADAGSELPPAASTPAGGTMGKRGARRGGASPPVHLRRSGSCGATQPPGDEELSCGVGRHHQALGPHRRVAGTAFPEAVRHELEGAEKRVGGDEQQRTGH